MVVTTTISERAPERIVTPVLDHSPDTIVPDISGHLSVYLQTYSHDFLEIPQVPLANIFRRVYQVLELAFCLL